MREYPEIPIDLPAPTRRISYICVKFSNDFNHNIMKSECIHNVNNEFIVIDNTDNIFYPTLTQAMNAGILMARNDLVVIVHEDVLLVSRWQAMFEQSLNALELSDPHWLVAGVIGWDANNQIKGHLSDPHSYRNTFNDAPFAEVTRIDEQILILRKSSGMMLDPELPSIHHIGRDMPLEAARRGGKAYVINAPSIHKYADEKGKIIQTITDSIKIKKRSSIQFLADRACCSEYISQKWDCLEPASIDNTIPEQLNHSAPQQLDQPPLSLTESQLNIAQSPVILLAKGGGGSRLLASMANDVSLFIGNKINQAGDSLEMADSIYRGIIRKHRCPNNAQKTLTVPDLIATSISMLEKASWPNHWGFKLPESIFLLNELHEAFPKAKYISFWRDPLSTTLRRSHMTARLDSPIGQITVPMAYDFYTLTKEQLFSENETIRMARTTAHQLELLMAFRQNVLPEKWLDLRFEDLSSEPNTILTKISNFTTLQMQSSESLSFFDPCRASHTENDISDETQQIVNTILEPIRTALKYPSEAINAGNS